MKRKITFTLLSFIIAISVFAQKTLKGKVVDAATNNTLTSATIIYAGKGATVTDKDGSFTVDCSKTSYIIVGTLFVLYLGTILVNGFKFSNCIISLFVFL